MVQLKMRQRALTEDTGYPASHSGQLLCAYVRRDSPQHGYRIKTEAEAAYMCVSHDTASEPGPYAIVQAVHYSQ